MAQTYQAPRGTKANLTALGGSAGLLPYQHYWLTDVNRLAVATSTTAFIEIPNVGELGGGGGVSDGDKGDITVSGSGATWTIDTGAVSLDKITTVPASRLIGRGAGAGPGILQELTLGTGLALSTTVLTAADPFPLATEVTSDAPTGGTPTAGVRLFAAVRANRRQPAYISPTGRTERLQSFLGGNDIMMVDVPAGGTLYNTLGCTMATDVGTASTPAITTTNVLTMQVRRVLAVAATANLMMESKATAPWCSRRLVGGGFHWSVRFGLETAMPATGRLFAGLANFTTAIASGDPSTQVLNSMGLVKNSADTTLSISMGTASMTSTALPNTGAVGWNVAGTIFDVEFFCKPGDADIGWRVKRTQPNGVNAPIVAVDEGVRLGAAGVPNINDLFTPHIWAQNVAATAMSIAIIQMYKESD